MSSRPERTRTRPPRYDSDSEDHEANNSSKKRKVSNVPSSSSSQTCGVEGKTAGSTTAAAARAAAGKAAVSPSSVPASALAGKIAEEAAAAVARSGAVDLPASTSNGAGALPPVPVESSGDRAPATAGYIPPVKAGERSPVHEPHLALQMFLLERTLEQSRAGLIVWAKMDGHPTWPAMIVPRHMTDHSSTNQVLVNFFNTPPNQSFGFVNIDKVYPFHDHYELQHHDAAASVGKKKRGSRDLQARRDAVKEAVEMQARIGYHVTRMLRPMTPGQEPDGTLPRNACYCINCFDGGDLFMCDHCPCAIHAHCGGFDPDAALADPNFFCAPCLRYLVGNVIVAVEKEFLRRRAAAAGASEHAKKVAAQFKQTSVVEVVGPGSEAATSAVADALRGGGAGGVGVGPGPGADAGAEPVSIQEDKLTHNMATAYFKGLRRLLVRNNAFALRSDFEKEARAVLDEIGRKCSHAPRVSTTIMAWHETVISAIEKIFSDSLVDDPTVHNTIDPPAPDTAKDTGNGGPVAPAAAQDQEDPAVAAAPPKPAVDETPVPDSQESAPPLA